MQTLAMGFPRVRRVVPGASLVVAVSCASGVERPAPEASSVPPLERIAYAVFDGQSSHLRVADTDGSRIWNDRKLTTEAADENGPSWSPDGRELAFSSDRGGLPQIHVVEVTLSGGPVMVGAAWSDAAGGAEWPSWSPDGQQLAYAARQDPEFDPEIVLHRRGGPDPRVLISRGTAPHWSADGSCIAWSSVTNLGGIVAHDLVEDTVVDLLDPRADMSDRIFAFLPRWSPSGEKVLFTKSVLGPRKEGLDTEAAPATLRPCVFVIDRVSHETTSMTEWEDSSVGLDWSPDGTRILISSDRDGNRELYTLALDGSDRRRLTETPEDEGMASWARIAQ